MIAFATWELLQIVIVLESVLRGLEVMWKSVEILVRVLLGIVEKFTQAETPYLLLVRARQGPVGVTLLKYPRRLLRILL